MVEWAGAAVAVLVWVEAPSISIVSPQQRLLVKPARRTHTPAAKPQRGPQPHTALLGKLTQRPPAPQGLHPTPAQPQPPLGLRPCRRPRLVRRGARLGPLALPLVRLSSRRAGLSTKPRTRHPRQRLPRLCLGCRFQEAQETCLMFPSQLSPWLPLRGPRLLPPPWVPNQQRAPLAAPSSTRAVRRPRSCPSRRCRQQRMSSSSRRQSLSRQTHRTPILPHQRERSAPLLETGTLLPLQQLSLRRG